MLNLQRLALLVEFERRGTLLDVSRALSYSPSTVSQQMRVLEREIGTALLDRSGRRLRLTQAGRLLAERSADILARIEEAEIEASSSHLVARGSLHLAAFQTMALAALPATLDRLRETAPELDLLMRHIDPTHALDALVASEFDLVLGEEYPGRPVSRQQDVETITLLDDPMLLVAPPDIDPARDVVEIAGSMPWVLSPGTTVGRQWSTAMCREMGVEPRVHYESLDLLVHLRLVETGHAVAVLPRLLLESENPDVRAMKLPGGPARRVFAAFRRGSRRSPSIAAVIDALEYSVGRR